MTEKFPETAPSVSRRLFNGTLAAGFVGLAFAGFRALRPSDGPALAEDVRYLRIGTGDVGGAYFRIGGILANVVSDPDSQSDCDGTGVCGVPGLIAISQATGGSVDNVNLLESGALEAGLCQSDVAYWAYRGEELFSGTPHAHIRAVANLYSEAVHMVVRTDDPITAIDQLRAKRVVVGAEGSGSLVGARIILAAFGLGFSDVTPIYENIGRGVAMLESGEADAVFAITGSPAPSLMPLASGAGFRLLPIDDGHAEIIVTLAPFFTKLRIPRDQYPNVGDTPTLAVGAQLFVRDDLEESLVFALTRALWHQSNRAVLNNSHPLGQRIALLTALDGMAVPLHSGASRFYESLPVSIDGPTARDEASVDTLVQ